MAIRLDVVADYIYDDSDNGVLDEWVKLHPNAIRSLTVRHMVFEIRARCATSTCEFLRIFGHGSPGAQWVAGGFSGGTQDFTRRNVQAIHVAGGVLQNVDILKSLQGTFKEKAIVELHGCGVGLSPAGQALATQLAKLWNVIVRAGTGLQYADAGAVFESGYIQVYPSGRVIQYSSSSPGFVVIARATPSAPKEKVHQVGDKVTKNDWLSSIALKHYGDLLLWPIIFDHNKSNMGPNPNPNVIRPKQKFLIPSIAGLTPQQLNQIRARGRKWR